MYFAARHPSNLFLLCGVLVYFCSTLCWPSSRVIALFFSMAAYQLHTSQCIVYNSSPFHVIALFHASSTLPSNQSVRDNFLFSYQDISLETSKTLAMRREYPQSALSSLIVAVVFAALAMLMVAFRVAGRRLKRVSLGWDDYAMIASLVRNAPVEERCKEATSKRSDNPYSFSYGPCPYSSFSVGPRYIGISACTLLNLFRCDPRR